MKKPIIILIGSLLALSFSLHAQIEKGPKWWNPAHNDFNVIEGQAWSNEDLGDYNRFPDRAEGNVANDVWYNSTHSAGLMIRFRSNTLLYRFAIK